MMFNQKQIEEIKLLLEECTDEELFEVFGSVYDKVQEVIQKRRPRAVYTNTSPYGIAKELHQNKKSFIS